MCASESASSPILNVDESRSRVPRSRHAAVPGRSEKFETWKVGILNTSKPFLPFCGGPETERLRHLGKTMLGKLATVREAVKT